MKRSWLTLLCVFFFIGIYAQSTLDRPKLVVGIVVDQMRWDFLYRYYNRYDVNGGFKRLLSKGYSCENTSIPYAQSLTACGHSAIYTGSVPAINGITGNGWYDYELNKNIYCTGDDSVSTVGSTSNNGQMSPKNLLVTTVCDELKLATNFKSKVVGIALKDRGSILAAGHSANAAYWYDNSNGNWISSTYYMQKLPQWVNDFNSKKLVDKYYADGWQTLYPLESYVESDISTSKTPNNVFGQGSKFPYTLSQFIGKNYGIIPATPQGNTFTFEMARAALQGEELGKDSITDFLAVSLSSPDYIGHTFGPNSVEAEDNYLKLDKELGLFLNYLDGQIGKNQYLVFLTADHGVAQEPFFLTSNKIPSGNFSNENIYTDLNSLLQDKLGVNDLVLDINNGQVYLNRQLKSKSKFSEKELYQLIIDYLVKQPFVARAFELSKIAETTLNKVIKEKVENGYYPLRSGDIQIITKPQWIEGFEKGGTTHGTWHPYDSHIPLLWYGWNIKPGKTNREISMTDIAPTICSLLHIQNPDGCIGKPIQEVIQ